MLTYAYVVLLDVLGYRDLLARDQDEGSDRFAEQLRSALEALNTVNEVEIQYQAISDTIILACGDRQKFDLVCETARRIFVRCLEEGLLLRGGIAYAQHFKSNHMTYSRAVARAYELESSAALFPRILVDHNILTMLNEDGFKLTEGALCRRNGTYFVNPATSAAEWTRSYHAAKSLFSAQRKRLEGVETAFAKHAWLHDFLMTHPLRAAAADEYIDAAVIVSTPVVAR